MKQKPQLIGLALLSGIGFTACEKETPPELPNILWLVSEDNSPFAGCYGDSFATTPNMDKLASQGFRYTHAYANAPVCAPARNTIITGVYANSGGNQHMRSYYEKSDLIRFFPQFLREKGYYCTNNAKEDYNIISNQTKNIWDESSNKANYQNRKDGQPFFAVFNCGISHESCLHKSIPTNELRHDPNLVTLPPYHPDTPEMRHDWAQYYDKIEDMDQWIGQKLQELEDAGLAENTIVFYYGDHGGVLGRSKRFVYESGTRVPFIVRIPEKFKHLFPSQNTGSKVDRLISFVDLAPTILSLCQAPVPDWMQGHAFLGEQKTDDPEYVHLFRGRMDERYDMSRAIRDQKFRYIRNYMPYRIYGQHLNYLWNAPSMSSWETAYHEGKCNATQSAFWETKSTEELYDTENDPWEENNLANDPAYKNELVRLRQANLDWMEEIYDTGIIPESMRSSLAGEQSLYDFVRSDSFPYLQILEVAELATTGDPANKETLLNLLKDENPLKRYWAATGLLILKEAAKDAIPQLKQTLTDQAVGVTIIVAEALYSLGEKEAGTKALLDALKAPNPYARAMALNSIDCIGIDTPTVRQAIIQMMIDTKDEPSPLRYDHRVVDWLFTKWEIDKSSFVFNLKA